MTKQEFIYNTKRKRIFQKGFEYLLALLPTIIGLFFLYKTNFTDWLESKSSTDTLSKEGANIFSLIFLLMGIYGIRTAINNYQIVAIHSDLTVDLKKGLLRQVANNLNIRILDMDSIPYLFHKDGGFFGYPQEINVYMDEEGFLIEIHSSRIGIVDFGYRSRFIKKIKKEMASLQPKKMAKAGWLA